MDFLYDWVVSSLGFVEGLQAWRTPLLNAYFLFMTSLGKEEFFLIVLPAIYWLYDKRLGRRLVYLLVLGVWTNEALKNLFQLPRPPEHLWMVKESNYGLPSGHAQIGVLLWGYAGWKLRPFGRWVLPLMLWIVASIAFSRLYVGVHYPADTLAGLVFGLLLLVLTLWAEPRLERWYGRLSTEQVILLVAALSVLALTLFPTAGKPWPVELAASQSGLLFGALVGLDAERRRVRFAVAGSWQQKTGRYLLGLLFLLLAWAGLRAVFGLMEGGHLVESVLRIVRYAVVGLTVTWWGPVLFVRLGLAHKE